MLIKCLAKATVGRGNVVFPGWGWKESEIIGCPFKAASPPRAAYRKVGRAGMALNRDELPLRFKRRIAVGTVMNQGNKMVSGLEKYQTGEGNLEVLDQKRRRRVLIKSGLHSCLAVADRQ